MDIQTKIMFVLIVWLWRISGGLIAGDDVGYSEYVTP